MASDEPRPVRNRIREMMGRITLTGPEIQASCEGDYVRAMRDQMRAELNSARMDIAARDTQRELAQLAVDRDQYFRNARFYQGVQWITNEQWEDVDKKMDPDLAMDIGL